MTALGRDRIRAALVEFPAQELPWNGDTRFASVAAVLRPSDTGARILFIRRSERASDPWSGHMAFPGGRKEPSDRDLLETSIRETREEVGLDLAEHGELLGALDDIVPGGVRGAPSSLLVRPYVWFVAEPPALVPNGVEVDEVHWVELEAMFAGTMNSTFRLPVRGDVFSFPSFRIAEEPERVVWGMTHRMLESLFSRLRGTDPSLGI